MDNATALGRTAIAVEHAGGLRLERDAVHCDAVDQDMRLRLAWLDSDLRRGAGLERQSVDRDAVPVAGRIVRDVGREHPDRLAVDEDLEFSGVAVSALADAERERVDRRTALALALADRNTERRRIPDEIGSASFRERVGQYV